MTYVAKYCNLQATQKYSDFKVKDDTNKASLHWLNGLKNGKRY